MTGISPRLFSGRQDGVLVLDLKCRIGGKRHEHLHRLGDVSMAVIDLSTLDAPISDSAPCGPDLELDGHADYMNFIAWAEGVLPQAFYISNPINGRLEQFDRSILNFDDSVGTLLKLLRATHDLRLLTILARFSILNRDLTGFSRSIDALANLLRTQWDFAHPQGKDGFISRWVNLQTLDDDPTVVQPLLHAPFFPSGRFGSITFRTILLDRGDAVAREGEDAPTHAAIETAFRDVELPSLLALRDDLDRVRTALVDIQNIWKERAGSTQAVTFSQVLPQAEKILTFIDEVVRRRDPTAVPVAHSQDTGATGAPSDAGAGIATASLPRSTLRSMDEVASALAAAVEYYSACEPSSPALLLVRQAQQLIGKSFLQVMQTLLPAHAGQASIRLGADQMFDLSVERLSNAGVSATDSYANGEEQSERCSETAQKGNGSSERPPLRAASRQEAIALLEQVAAFYRQNEPASPIPLLTERACGLSQKDFLGVLKDILPGLPSRANDGSN